MNGLEQETLYCHEALQMLLASSFERILLTNAKEEDSILFQLVFAITNTIESIDAITVYAKW